ncbi:cell division protein FtsA [Clostridium ganghwense]|uniref:Cell division protein FtsA n=1 Tax=Clostridium ganghwense TaxID=312089 RepID=A0ABT4CTC6_9CLOT|nr:cell division protein FtsA [Clostridium ganghwense]MCY6372330.1 cell division protein FtsA [Clostridium ganghwense]
MHEYIVGLDIGSSNVYGAVGKVDIEGEIRIIGITAVKCNGLKKSVVVDIDSTSQSIKECIKNLERMVDISISDVYITLPAGISELVWNKGIVAVSADDKEIKENDVLRVLDAARLISVPQDKEIIGVVPYQYIVDGYDHIIEPVGMSGTRLEVDAQIVMAQSTVVNNLRKSINRAGISIAGEVLQQQAISQVASNKEEINMGVAFVDIGAQTTDISIYKRENLCYTSMVPLGGDNITNDISICLKIPFAEAEKLKTKYGELSKKYDEENRKIAVNAGYNHSIEADLGYLQNVIEARTEEILYYVKDKLEQSKYNDEISGVVIVGGGLALFKGIDEYASKILGKSVKIGFPNYIGAASPVYATVVGIIKDVVSSLRISKNSDEAKKEVSSNSKIKTNINKKENEDSFVSKLKEFFTEFF